MSVWFTSDLHLGHNLIAYHRGFNTVQEHNSTIVDNINSVVNKRDKLFILGDVSFSDKGLQAAKGILCQNIELVMGNHDKYPIQKYISMGWKLHGFRGYKNFWLSHCPIHPNEMRQKLGNLHGHIHKFGDTAPVTEGKYFNVNIEFHDLKPISFIHIEEVFFNR